MAAKTQLPTTLLKFLMDGTVALDKDNIRCTLITSDSNFVATSTTWATGIAKNEGDLVVPTSDNGHVYYCSSGGLTGGSEPAWTKDGSSISDGTVTWIDAGANIDITQSIWIEDATMWQASYNYSIGVLVRPTGSNANGHYYEVTNDAGSSGGTEPTWPTGSGTTVVDGGITWTEQGVNFAANEVSGTGYTDKGNTLANKLITSSTIFSKFDADDVIWASSTIAARFAILWKQGIANGITNPLILMVLLDDTPSDVASSNSNFSVLWNSEGILKSVPGWV